jgi:hypothetical protein
MTPVTFELLRSRLIGYANYRIRNGEYSERSLARIVGISQPQLHNVLKGCRTLSPDLADRLLRHFGIGCIDLLEPEEREPSNGAQPARYDIARKSPQPEIRLWPEARRRTGSS